MWVNLWNLKLDNTQNFFLSNLESSCFSKLFIGSESILARAPFALDFSWAEHFISIILGKSGNFSFQKFYKFEIFKIQGNLLHYRPIWHPVGIVFNLYRCKIRNFEKITDTHSLLRVSLNTRAINTHEYFSLFLKQQFPIELISQWEEKYFFCRDSIFCTIYSPWPIPINKPA